jgi:arginyl-tRNA synthetase
LEKYLLSLFSEVSEKLTYLKEIDLVFNVPQQTEHGDLSSNAAMLLAKRLKKKPREIAEEIIANLNSDPEIIEKIEIAGAGFINFFFKKSFLPAIVKEILLKKADFGKSEKNKGKRANVEFVSANPTGPLTVGHCRNAVLGDVVARLLEFTGYEVEREYYFNNAGRQMRLLGDSVRLRYLEILGEKIEFPEEYYQREYISEIAMQLFEKYSDKLRDENPEGIFKETAEQQIFNQIKTTLERLGIKHDVFFNENSLYDSKKIDLLIEELSSRNLIYSQENALWLKLSEMGEEKDKVVIKSSGEPTYRLPDIAYHIEKFRRDYDLMVDVFGTDHIEEYPDVLASLKVLGYDTSKVVVLIYQFVNMIVNGEVLKMSTRKGNYITLDSLIDEVGADVVRYFFIMRDRNTHINFDLDLAKKQSEENPVFYLQYAHARICSIMKMTDEQELVPSTENLHLLDSPEETDILKRLHEFEKVVSRSAEVFEPSSICVYLEELAAAFHKFYRFRRIIGSEKSVAEARLALITAVKLILGNGLGILGVNAPERM